MPEATTYIVTCVDPETRRQKQKSFSLKKYSREEAERLGAEWKESILNKVAHMGNKQEKQEEIPENISISSGDTDPGLAGKPHFKFASIDSLELPDDKFGVSFLLMGMTRSGKSTLMNYLYDTLFRGHVTILHTASAQSEIYKPLAKSTAVCPMFAPQLISECSKINGATKNHYKFLHIIDDIVDKKNSKELIKLLTIGRNHRLSTIITGQELSIFNSIGRSNINFVCCFKMGNDMAIEKVVKSYLRSAFPSSMRLNDMIKAYKQVTENHGFFVIDNLNNRIFVSRLTL